MLSKSGLSLRFSDTVRGPVERRPSQSLSRFRFRVLEGRGGKETGQKRRNQLSITPAPPTWTSSAEGEARPPESGVQFGPSHKEPRFRREKPHTGRVVGVVIAENRGIQPVGYG